MIVMAGAMFFTGQARKSLWIETLQQTSPCGATVGQARKSLWIETCWLKPRLVALARSGS